MPRRKNTAGDTLIARGSYRIQITEQGNVIGDSGWKHNTVVNDGFRTYLQFAMIGSAGSKTVGYGALGTGTAAIASNDTSLTGELTDATNCRCVVTSGTSGSRTVTFTFTLASNVITAAKTIGNVGLFSSNVTNTAGMFSAALYGTSSLATNQAVNATYQISFA